MADQRSSGRGRDLRHAHHRFYVTVVTGGVCNCRRTLRPVGEKLGRSELTTKGERCVVVDDMPGSSRASARS